MSNYDSNMESKYIVYLDFNNLYGWAMNQPLPVGGFKWMEQHEFENWKAGGANGESIPCFLEVDLEYPQELHDLHNEYPLAPESVWLAQSVERPPSVLTTQ